MRDANGIPTLPGRSATGATAAARGAAAHGSVALGGGIALACGRVHEAVGPAADAFAVVVAAAAAGTTQSGAADGAAPVFWIGLDRDVESLAPTGLQGFLDPARIVLVAALTRKEILWAAEQALRGARATVVAEIARGPDLQESRRLQLAAEETGALGLCVVQGETRASAAETRWRCDPAGPGQWIWTCTKDRRGGLGARRVRWRGGCHAGDFRGEGCHEGGFRGQASGEPGVVDPVYAPAA